ncbi:MAG: phosphoribosylamine--glycine ligase family protein, partial [Clostridia bacterium]|nr:phosphoribosylamine--glycine ligase family protein [Clostridia bacterium]
MKVLVVGGGGREHAIIKKVKQNPKVEQIFAAPGNGGIAADATCVAIDAKNIDAIAEFAVKEKIDYSNNSFIDKAFTLS